MSSPLDRPMATLRLAASGLDPAVITALLGRPPAVGAREGERLYESPRTRATARTGTWLITTESLASRSPSDHLNDLVSLIVPHRDELRTLLPTLDISFSVLLPSSLVADIPEDLKRRAEYLGRLEIEALDLHAV